jgi:hypothetical protein
MTFESMVYYINQNFFIMFSQCILVYKRENISMSGQHPIVPKGEVSPGVELDDEGDSDLEMSLEEVVGSEFEPPKLKQVAARGLDLLKKTDSKQGADKESSKFSQDEQTVFENFVNVIQELDAEISRLQEQITQSQNQLTELIRKKISFTEMEKRLREIITKRRHSMTSGGSRRRRRRRTKRRKTARRKRRASKNSLH